ncbi:MAG: hypothetical protein CW342_15280 [Thermoactinomycetaceae bacterium]|nr:hypothetical protein [Bacillota bacterium]MBO2534208.1 hypothetical protein [Thermoactinomycetaceae bacterium]
MNIEDPTTTPSVDGHSPRYRRRGIRSVTMNCFTVQETDRRRITRLLVKKENSVCPKDLWNPRG